MNKTLRPWRDAGRQAKLLSMKQRRWVKKLEVVSHYKLPVESLILSLPIIFSGKGIWM